MSGKALAVHYSGQYEYGAVQQDIGALASDRQYRLRFRLKASAGAKGQRFLVVVQQGELTFTQRMYAARDQSTLHEVIFSPPDSGPGRLVFHFPNTAGAPFYVDDISLLEVEAAYQDPRFKFPIYLNETAEDLEIPLDPHYLFRDLDGTDVISPLTLAPFHSQVLVRDASRLTLGFGSPELCPLDTAGLDAGDFVSYRWWFRQPGGEWQLLVGMNGRTLVVHGAEAALGDYRCEVTDAQNFDWESNVFTFSRGLNCN